MPAAISDLYQKLPTELQLKIWEFAVEPRTIKVFDHSLREKFLEQRWEYAPPIVLQVCHMLRAHFLPRYPQLFDGEPDSSILVHAKVRINSLLDTVVIYSGTPQAFINLSRRTGHDDLAKIRHLGILSFLWQCAVISHQYPDWRKAMSKFPSLETFTIVSDEMIPKFSEDGDRFKQAIERTLLSVQADKEDWTPPQVQVIRIGDTCHKVGSGIDRLDLVDFAKGDVKASYLAHFTEPGSDTLFSDRMWDMKIFHSGFPILWQIRQRPLHSTPTYNPRPSVFGLGSNELLVQAQGSRSMLDEFAYFVPCALAALTFISFTVTSSTLEAIF